MALAKDGGDCIMDKQYVVIGWGDIASLICDHPQVAGYVRAPDFDHFRSNDTGAIIGNLDRAYHKGVIGVGKGTFKELRSKEWLNHGYNLGILVDPTASVSPRARIGQGSVIMPLAFVDGESTIGECTIIGPQSALRIATIGNYAHLAIQCKVLSRAKVGDFAFIGSGATIDEGVVIGSHAAIGGGTYVRENVPNRYLCYEKHNNKLQEVISLFPLTNEEKMRREKKHDR